MNSGRLVRAIGKGCPLCRPDKALPWKIQRIGISYAQVLRAASSFKMPAMSPTMTEGNIASWKVKEGESFDAGDVLLEIETDKAQMDVEAQDSGILAKILVPDGTQKVDVGKVIAVLAEEGDDISAVGVPEESLDTSSTEPANKVKEKSRDVAQTSQDEHKRHLKFENTYLPAVLRLLQLHGIEDPTQIHGTGPHGRLLKGDVLAHLGTIKSDVPKSLQRILEEKQRLDLSNIVIQRGQDKPQPAAVYSSEATMKPPPFACIEETIGLTAALQVQKEISDLFSLEVSLESLVEKASKQALADVPQFGRRKLRSTDLIFAELVGDNRGKRIEQYPKAGKEAGEISREVLCGQLPHLPESFYGQKRIVNLPGQAIMRFEPSTNDKSPRVQVTDPFDELLGIPPNSKPIIKNTSNFSPSREVQVKLEFDDAIIDTDAATAYLARFRYHIESPSHLLLGL